MAREIASNVKAYSGADFYATTAELSASRKLNSSTVTALARKEKRLEHVAYLVIKRSFDFVTSLVGCVFLLPVIVFVKVGNMLTGDFKPMFLKQERIGRDGKVFKLLKFRSMVMLDDGRQADALLDDLFEKRPDLKKQWDKYHKLDNDPRITKMGKFIRKTSLDELPQLINILKGDMSIIGPRPLMIGELDQHRGNHEIYESVRPGLTGWWACNGRSELSYPERLKLEYYYCEHASLVLDVKCFAKTVLAVLKKEGSK